MTSWDLAKKIREDAEAFAEDLSDDFRVRVNQCIRFERELAEKLDQWAAEKDKVIQSLAARVEKQADLLAKKAEKPNG